MKKREGHYHGLISTLLGWNDFLWAFALSMSAVVAVLATMAIKVKEDSKTTDSHPAGSISVYVFWQDGLDMDNDTHIMGPDGEHIFYGNKAGRNWNLLRDDLGKAGDDFDKNFENAFSRGIEPGEYVINMHAYRGTPEMYPQVIHIEVTVTTDPKAGKGAGTVIKQTVTLYKVKEEVTVVRFALTAKGEVVSGSVNHVHKSIIKQD